MESNDDWAKLRCPQCDHVIVLAPKDNLPRGELVCPGCGAKFRAPGRVASWLDGLKRKARSFVEPPSPRPRD